MLSYKDYTSKDINESIGIVDGKNVILFDDILVSGNTISEMIRNIENYSP